MTAPRSAATRPAGRPAAKDARGALLRSLPQVHAVMEQEELRRAAEEQGRGLVAALVRERLAELRRRIRSGALDAGDVSGVIAALPSFVEQAARARTTTSIRPVINATGVVLHTNLGRAVLPEVATRRMVEVARSYTTLEYDLERGVRGSRSGHLDRLFGLLFPGRAFHVVNNNAAAVLLALNTLAEGKEVIVSRGELVEIGGSFRIPDVMRKSGAVLREVGTTNRTRLRDYERAIGPTTGLILKVHPSNYRIVGFTAQASLQEIAALGRRRRIPVLYDQGSGTLLDLRPHGLLNEPSVFEALADGVDVVCFSGDKMLGGPQAGLIVGRKDLIAPMRENSLTRALRVDKVTYAALESVLLEYVRGTAESNLPVLRMVTMTSRAIEARARNLMDRVTTRAGGRLALSIVPGQSVSGGGSAPGEGLRTALLAVAARGRSARAVESALRAGAPPVIARIEEGRVLLDLRTVPQEQETALEDALVALARGD
jgi:L-seryl-tRNA(Ser) seleniumtransferase